MDPNTDLDAGPHTDPNLGIQDIIMSHFANLICFETYNPPKNPKPKKHGWISYQNNFRREDGWWPQT